MSSPNRARNLDDAAGSVTVPAPSGMRSASGEREIDLAADTPSERPTTMPDLDIEARALASRPPPDDERALPSDFPIERAIPVRRRASIDGTPLRAAFLLYHVDDRMSVGEIARSAQIPIHEAVECFVLLADLGLVALQTPAP